MVWKEKDIRLCERIAVEKHIYIATRTEKIQNSKHWILTINAEGGTQHPLDQRPDFAQAKRECKRLHDEHLARTQEEYRTTPHSQQTRQPKGQTKTITTQLTRKQVRGSTNSRGETCRKLTVSLPQTNPTVLNPYTPCDVPLQNGGSTQIPSLTFSYAMALMDKIQGWEDEEKRAGSKFAGCMWIHNKNR